MQIYENSFSDFRCFIKIEVAWDYGYGRRRLQDDVPFSFFVPPERGCNKLDYNAPPPPVCGALYEVTLPLPIEKAVDLFRRPFALPIHKMKTFEYSLELGSPDYSFILPGRTPVWISR